jgi:hypothetical protein
MNAVSVFFLILFEIILADIARCHQLPITRKNLLNIPIRGEKPHSFRHRVQQPESTKNGPSKAPGSDKIRDSKVGTWVFRIECETAEV